MEVFYYQSFLRQLKKLPKSVRNSARVRTELFMKNPNDPILKLHKLSGRLKGYHAFSIDFHYRIVLEIKEAKAIFHLIGTHEIYEG